ncbi:RyR domain-containing protein [Candidatus Thiothrix anitrata]|uniref:Ryanodine receptor Ryr domain-containing protein n=1 Tax=Candidatus Thiothrix anitrata TaxID=2823902 RepID=A0ABX7X7R7_9GAMM|nr:RyR domain-containing protein [Candidatus Thiothrix anitrata]QTR51213.1 hypothetical protein J8380_06605 [Candidatus Thiothrix anitrata]
MLISPKSPRNIALVFTLIAILVMALGLMYTGFLEQQAVVGGKTYGLTRGEAFYAAVNLLLYHQLIKPEDMQHHNIWIILGQFLGYMAFYGTILLLVWNTLGSWFSGVWVRLFYKAHWVVCGLNAQGRAFINNALMTDPRLKLVVLLPEMDESMQSFTDQHQGRVKLVKGNATLSEHLQRAAAQQASKIIACTDATDVNLQIANAVSGLFADASVKRSKKLGKLDLHVSIADQQLANSIGHETYQHFLQPNQPFMVQMYTPHSLIARYFFRRYPPHVRADWQQQSRVHLVFVGYGALAEAMMHHYAQISPYKHFGLPVFTLLGPKAETHKRALLQRYPAFNNERAHTAAETVVEHVQALECDASFNLDAAQLDQISAVSAPTAILFCDGQGEQNFSRAMKLHQCTLLHNRWHSPFYIYLDDAQGMQALLDSAASKYPARQLVPFGMAEDIFNLRRLDELEENARFVHEAYRESQHPGIGELDSASLPANLKPWVDLPETYRNSNRRTGDHIAVKLASIRCHVAPEGSLILSDDIVLGAPAERLDLLSRLEHQSWCYERLMSGWRYAEQRHNERRLHPAIRLWEDLSEAEQSKDVNQIENVRRSLIEEYGTSAVSVRQELVVGLIGHNYLTFEQAQHVCRQLQASVLPELLRSYPGFFFTLLTPLAPGSDFILASEALRWFGERKIPSRLLVVQAISLEKVVDAYRVNWEGGASWDGVYFYPSQALDQQMAETAWQQGKESILKQLRTLIDSDACQGVIDLTLLGDETERNAIAYERAAEYIVKRSDELVAVFDVSRQPGGIGGTKATLDSWGRKAEGADARIITL